MAFICLSHPSCPCHAWEIFGPHLASIRQVPAPRQELPLRPMPWVQGGNTRCSLSPEHFRAFFPPRDGGEPSQPCEVLRASEGERALARAHRVWLRASSEEGQADCVHIWSDNLSGIRGFSIEIFGLSFRLANLSVNLGGSFLRPTALLAWWSTQNLVV